MVVPYWDLCKLVLHASRTRATNPARPPVTEPVDRVYAGKVTVARTRVDVPMLVLRGEWLKAIGFPIGAKAVPLHRQTGRHPAHAHGPQAPAQAEGSQSEGLGDRPGV